MNSAIDNLNMNDTLRYDGTAVVASDNCMVTWPSYWQTYQPICYNTYQPSRIEQGFKVVSKMLELKLIDNITLKKFIELVGKIAEIL